MLFCSLPRLFIFNYLCGNFFTLLAFFLLLYMYYLFHLSIFPSTSLLSVFCLTYPTYPENTGQIRLARSLGRTVHIHRNIPVKHWFNIFICLAPPLQIWVSRLLPPRSTTRFLWLQSCPFCSSYSWVLHCLEIGLQRTIESTIHHLGRTETGHPGPACLRSIPHPTYFMQLHIYLFIPFCHALLFYWYPLRYAPTSNTHSSSVFNSLWYFLPFVFFSPFPSHSCIITKAAICTFRGVKDGTYDDYDHDHGTELKGDVCFCFSFVWSL